MATNEVLLNAEWTIIHTGTQPAVFENSYAVDIEITFSASVPAVDAPSHRLKCGARMDSIGTDKVYARCKHGVGLVTISS